MFFERLYMNTDEGSCTMSRHDEKCPKSKGTLTIRLSHRGPQESQCVKLK